MPADAAAARAALIRRRWAAFAVALAVIMSTLDGMMLNVALPAIARSLHAAPADAIWVVNAYQLAAVMVLLPIGKLADIHGHRRVYLVCMALFTIASLGCALSRTLWQLSLCRFVQGCGGAGVIGITNAMLRLIHPPSTLARGIGVNSMAVAMALASGPTLASLILGVARWPWLFLVNLPIGVALLVVGARALPAGAVAEERFDLASALLAMATFGLLLVAIDWGAHGSGPAMSLVLGCGCAFFGVLLVRRQFLLAAPLFPVDLLRGRIFGLSVGTIFGASMAQVIAYIALPFFFLNDLGFTQLQTGLLFLPWPLAIACAASLAGRLSGYIPSGLMCAVGLTAFAAGLGGLALLNPGAALWDVGMRMALCGVGYGVFQPPSSRAMIVSAPLTRVASASVMGAMARVLGQATGAALVAMLFGLMPANGRAAALALAAGIALAAAAASLARGGRAPD